MPLPLADGLKALLQRYELPLDAATPLSTLLDELTQPGAPTSVHEPKRAIDVHIADSLAALEVNGLREARTVADLGSGAGLPGLVLAAVLPSARVTLVEAARRKCDFLSSTARAMAIDNVDVVWSRAEEWRDGLGRCDVIGARALASLPVVCEYAAPLLRVGGVLVAWKGEVAPSEALDAAAAASHLGLTTAPVRSVTPFPGSRRLTLHVFHKVGATPANFPRRAGIATKRPLSAKNLA